MVSLSLKLAMTRGANPSALTEPRSVTAHVPSPKTASWL
jgi:hypothetical protein